MSERTFFWASRHVSKEQAPEEEGSAFYCSGLMKRLRRHRLLPLVCLVVFFACTTTWYLSSKDFVWRPLLWPAEREMRVAVLLPIHGAKLADWFPYWLQSCREPSNQTTHFAVEWFIFHEDIKIIEQWHKECPFPLPHNVHFINLYQNGIVDLFGVKSAQALDRDAREQVELYRKKFKEHGGYLLTELKGLFGLVFEDYIGEGFSHWAWADHDIMWGDLQTWIEEQELRDFDIVSYSFGDNLAVYLRGQLTLFRNDERNRLLWRECDLLTGDDLKPRGSDEGCYSYHVLQQPGMKIKIATKQATPFDSKSVWYWIDGQLVEHRASEGNESYVFEEALTAHYSTVFSASSSSLPPSPSPSADNTSSSEGGSPPTSSSTSTSSSADRSSSFTPPPVSASQISLSKWERTSALDASKCADWMIPIYRVCVALPSRHWLHNLFVDDGTIYRQSFEFAHPSERAFVHLLRWKYTLRVTQPAAGTKVMVFRISSEGIVPLVSVPMADNECAAEPSPSLVW